MSSGGAVVGGPHCLIVPPPVTPLRPWNLISRALENKDVLDLRAALERRVDNSLGRNSLPSATPFDGSKDDTTLAVIDTVTKGVCRKASEYHKVNGTDAGTCEEGGDGLPCHGQVDRDSVPLLDTEGFEHAALQFSKAGLTACAWLISFVDDCGLR